MRTLSLSLSKDAFFAFAAARRQSPAVEKTGCDR